MGSYVSNRDWGHQMKGVSLVSGGLDSTLMTILLKEEKIEQIPVFINYGQLAAKNEWITCKKNFSELNLPTPTYVDLKGYGNQINSGITDPSKDIFKEAFLPGRNMLFLLTGAAISLNNGGSFVSIGLLSEAFSIFPDQRKQFLDSMETTLELALGKRIKIMTPVYEFSKVDSIVLAKNMGMDIEKTYYCHRGRKKPCGICISCKERLDAMKIIEQNEVK